MPDQLPLTREQQSDLLRDSRNHAAWCKESLRVLDRMGSRVPMDLWPSQEKLHRTILAQRRKRKPVRIVVLKTRRSGFTLGVCAEMFTEVTRFPGRKVSIIADKLKPAGHEAYGYIKQFQDNYVPFERHGFKLWNPDLLAAAEDKHMEWDGDRRFDLLSAESREVRGGGRHFVLGDEMAFWEAPEITLPGLLGMVPADLIDTTIVLQSTANGIGGKFWELWQQASDPDNQSEWVALFFGWLEHPLYQMAVADARKFQDSLDGEERTLREMHHASLEQLAWRRNIIHTVLGGSVDLFHQEFPTTPEEAFLASGRPALDGPAIARQPAADGMVGELKVEQQFPRDVVAFHQREHGVLEIFKLPQRGRQYVSAMDPARGIDVSTAKRGEDPDYCAMPICDADTGEQVAMFHARLRPAAFAKYGALCAALYNYAFLIPENNDAGFIDALVATGYPMERIYQMERDPTDVRSSRLDEIGFETTTLTRSWLVSAIDDALMDGSITIHSRTCIKELRTFVIKPNGKAEHAVGCHDDCVLSLALLVIGMRRYHQLRPKEYKAQTPGQRSRLMTSYGKRKPVDDD